ncbi:MAG TPA: hypothetical protein VFM51_00515 [Solirubrobacterales bacterium]|nr:hypothetical protein [Solirubrobacterales bacterium]
MARNLRRLSSALVAFLALTAVATSTASAKEFEFWSDGGTVTVFRGESKPMVSEKWKFDGGELQCKQATYQGTQGGEKTQALILSPQFENCTFGALEAEVHDNGCTFKFDQDNNTENGKFDAVTKITCGENQEITVTAKEGATVACTIHIPEQELGTGTVFTNKENDENIKYYEVDISLSSIKYSQTEGAGSKKCSTADNKNNGTFTATPIIRGYAEGGITETDVWVA